MPSARTIAHMPASTKGTAKTSAFTAPAPISGVAVATAATAASAT